MVILLTLLNKSTAANQATVDSARSDLRKAWRMHAGTNPTSQLNDSTRSRLILLAGQQSFSLRFPSDLEPGLEPVPNKD
jgi:hypothetical protein